MIESSDFMILRMPAYCREFKCIADKCSDSCCIGWEIDIDEKTVDFYKNVGGKLGEKLRASISCDDGYSFILKNERCPFLDENNLCELILEIGEDKLSQICTDHPRYYEWFSGVKEGGIGMCCEEAARLILEKGNETGYWDREVADEACDDYDEELYDCLFGIREKLFSYLRNRNIPLSSAVADILDYVEMVQEKLDNGDYSVPEINSGVVSSGEPLYNELIEIFGSLEPIDGNWKPYITELKNKPYRGYCTDNEGYLRNVMIYFLWRYFMKGAFDGEILSKVKLSVISGAMLSVMFSQASEEEQKIILAKNYSKELEYSEENLEAVYDMAYTEKVFSSDELKKFFV